MLSMKAKLKDGTEVEILDSPEKIHVREYLEYINAMMEEGAWLTHKRKSTMKEEKFWKRDVISKIKRGRMIYLVAVRGGKVAGASSAEKGIGRNENNVCIGIAISGKFRGKGLGELLMRRAIAVAREKFRPKNIFLTVAEPNKAALKLYEKVGFRKIARFPDWIEKDGKYYAQLWMVLK
jgi:ribosomal protein S18 acetylase RimI-like enzyme